MLTKRKSLKFQQLYHCFRYLQNFKNFLAVCLLHLKRGLFILSHRMKRTIENLYLYVLFVFFNIVSESLFKTYVFKAVVTYFKYSHGFKYLIKNCGIFQLHMTSQNFGKNKLYMSLKWQHLLVFQYMGIYFNFCQEMWRSTFMATMISALI